jgi:putative endonuclease
LSDPARTELKKRVYAQRYVYLLRCADDTLYCGISTDPQARLKQHNYGVGAKYTRGRGPCELVHVEGPYEYGRALSREAEIKRMTRQQKESLIDSTKNRC